MTAFDPMVLRPAPGLRIDRGGRRLLGGLPTRVISLSDAGAELVARWFAGEPVGPGSANQSLARRLIEADMAIIMPITSGCAPAEPAEPSELTVVIPVCDDPDGLATTLDALGGPHVGGIKDPAGCTTTIVVVDDGSEPPVATLPIRGASVTVVRRSRPSGPGNARNLGSSAVYTPIVVFVDAGVIVSPSQLATLARELSLGDTVAVAPRVRSEPQPSWLACYEEDWSPLDMGVQPGVVGPGRRISYVPSTCLMIRSSALAETGGFDPDLRYGEDVDLVWRLGSAGWVRYLPNVEVTHPPRSTLSAFVRQRFRYGSSAGPLARRHGWRVAPARLDRRSTIGWAALSAGGPVPTALATGWSTYGQVRTLVDCDIDRNQAVRMVATGWIRTAKGLAMAVARTWWPIAAIVMLRGRRLQPGSVLLLAGWLRRLRRPEPNSEGHESNATVSDSCHSTFVNVIVGIVDDSAYALGVWRGSIAARTVQPLLPHVARGQRATEGSSRRPATER